MRGRFDYPPGSLDFAKLYEITGENVVGWTISDMPSLHGKTAVVTGAGGLGYETALGLAHAGAEVIVAGRNPAKGEQAVSRIRGQVPQANVSFGEVDLASLASIARFGTRLKAERKSLDILVNNAGLMSPPKRRETADGFEVQFGTNHLGHFALTGHLLPLLKAGREPRVVTVASIAAKGPKAIDFDDLQSQRSYSPFSSYGLSKIANVLFAYELQRRSAAGGWGLISNAAHPGFSRTDLIDNNIGTKSGMMNFYLAVLERFLSQTAAEGALPTLYAAAAPEAKGGLFYGPDGFMEMKGAPAVAKNPRLADQPGLGERLWEVSEQLTGVRYA
jgi:NAD(P)-dependent dehydrogenase (short-subunit alcohol dehydrogenase family)